MKAVKRIFKLFVFLVGALIALVLIVIGIINGGLEDVLAKGAAICTECVGLG